MTTTEKIGRPLGLHTTEYRRNFEAVQKAKAAPRYCASEECKDSEGSRTRLSAYNPGDYCWWCEPGGATIPKKPQETKRTGRPKGALGAGHHLLYGFKAAKRRSRLTTEEVAKKAGLSTSSIQDYMYLRRGAPERRLDALAGAVGTTVKQLKRKPPKGE